MVYTRSITQRYTRTLPRVSRRILLSFGRVVITKLLTLIAPMRPIAAVHSKPQPQHLVCSKLTQSERTDANGNNCKRTRVVSPKYPRETIHRSSVACTHEYTFSVQIHDRQFVLDLCTYRWQYVFLV